MSDIWFTSDQHFGHKNIYNFTTYLDWQNQDAETVYVRPEFSNSFECDQYMLDKLAAVLKNNDKIYFLGDVAMDHKYIDELAKLPGTKILILGNHDNFKMSKYKNAFKRIYAYRDVSNLFPKELGKQIVTHCPCHMETFYPHTNVTNIHGHTHEKIVRKDDGSIDKRYINISVELTEYKPLHIDEITKMISNGETTYTKRFALGAIYHPGYYPKGTHKKALQKPQMLG